MYDPWSEYLTPEIVENPTSSCNSFQTSLYADIEAASVVVPPWVGKLPGM